MTKDKELYQTFLHYIEKVVDEKVLYFSAPNQDLIM